MRLCQADTRGAVPDKESRSPFLYYQSEGWRPECKQDSVTAVRHSLHQGQFNTKRELLLSDTTPRVSTLCLPDTTARNQISQAFPLCICIL